MAKKGAKEQGGAKAARKETKKLIEVCYIMSCATCRFCARPGLVPARQAWHGQGHHPHDKAQSLRYACALPIERSACPLMTHYIGTAVLEFACRTRLLA